MENLGYEIRQIHGTTIYPQPSESQNIFKKVLKNSGKIINFFLFIFFSSLSSTTVASSTAPSLSEYSSRFASYNGLTASAAAAARSAETAYFGSASAAANSFGPYAAAYAAQNMMNWNSYSLATYQGLQREGVTYGKTYTSTSL